MMTQGSSPGHIASRPLISVIAPCYNAERFLHAALESIFAQDYPNFEVIIVDDGSSDQSLAMLQALQSTYSFTLLTQANQGVSSALNTGLRHARGVYVATPDLDDLMLPQSLSVRAAYLDAHPEVGCVAALISYMDSEGRDIKAQRRSAIRTYDFAQILYDAVVTGAPTSLYRMQALRDAGFYDPSIKVQDFQMTLRIAAQGYQVHELPVCVTRYRRHPGNLSRKYRVMLEADLQAIAPYKERPGYDHARTVLVHKALKYAVVDDKPYAWSLLRSIPLRHYNKTTFRRIKRLIFHR
ncbi:glycosyltransferase family 2 protein [Pseudomonas sp. SC11]|uniref:glycosyltransferase family 2 protein n=1 Tax=Pseudomonas sp. SC11 TaxID=326927 RepID=UPI00399994DF